MKIELTETEIIHIMDSLRSRINDLRESHSISALAEEADLANELEEIEHDLFEASSRIDDGWLQEPDEPTDLVGQTFSVAEDHFIEAGTAAREQQKASSMAATRRNERMMQGTASPIANDPVDW